MDLRSIPVILVERIHPLRNLNPDRGVLARLQNAVAVTSTLRNRPLNRRSPALIAFLPEDIERHRPPVENLHRGWSGQYVRSDQDRDALCRRFPAIVGDYSREARGREVA